MCRRRKRVCAATLAATGIVAAVVAALMCCGDRSGTVASAGDGAAGNAYAVRLLNRTITVRDGGGAAAFAPFPSAASRRGTAPFVLVANSRVTKAIRARAEQCGARVSGVIPPYGLIVEADADAYGRLAGDGTFAAAEVLTADDKMSRSLKAAIAGHGDVNVTVVPLMPCDAKEIGAALAAAGIVPVDVSDSGRGCVRATVPSDMVKSIAERGDVRWVERYVKPRPLNDVAVGPGLMNVSVVRDVHGLTGNGQTVTVSDTGLDTGDPETVMEDFKGRIGFIGTVDGCLGYDLRGHGTHVAGSIAGNGALSGGMIKGVAYEATLNVWQCSDASGDLYIPAELSTLFQPDAKNSRSYIHSGSWGADVASEYNSMCIGVDEWMWRHPDYLSMFAAGNARNSACVTNSICAPAGAKNVIAVGATESLRAGKGLKADNASQMASFSLNGPMDDGRIKPDLCAPGTYILSTRSTRTSSTGWGVYADNANYMYDGGTSMATPLVSGSAALVRQWLVERRGYTNEPPTAALMRAVLTGGAHDMSGDAGANCGGVAPNCSQGWGRVNAGESLYPTNAAVVLSDRIPFADGETYTVRVTVTNAAPLSAQLVWTDYPGEYGAAMSLVNDLDLVVSNETTGAVWYGNGADGGDRTNNMESVRIVVADAGTYSVMVRGVCVPYDCMEGGAAALYVRGAFDGDGNAEADVETVLLTIQAEGGESAEVEPSAGTHRVTKGVPLKLSAGDAVVSEGSSGVTAKRNIAGWIGSGDIPASGTNGQVSVRLSQDSFIKWRWEDGTNLRVRSYIMIPSYGNSYMEYGDLWSEFGQRWRFRVPEEVEMFDLTDGGLKYVDEDGAQKPLTVQRLGKIEIAEADALSGTALTNTCGHMPTEFAFAVLRPTDILYSYYDVAATNIETTLPTWWYERYVAHNPAADAVRFVSVSPQRIEWTGGAGHARILERTTSLADGADWMPVHTNAPQPVLTNSWMVPTVFSTNSFYRIVW